VLDLSGVTFMDSTALGVIVGARRAADAAGRRMAVAGAPEAVVRLFTITQVDRLVTMYDDVDAALDDDGAIS
jgi:anti-sigma B factor antagonist